MQYMIKNKKKIARKPERRRSLGKPRYRLENNCKIY
jgi:hypothetical protein